MTQEAGQDPLQLPAIRALGEEMARYGNDREAPARSVMAMLGDRWTTLLLLILETGTLRHADLKRVVAQLSSEQAISQRVLTLKLRALERDGFVLRSVSGDVPPKVSYCLSPLGAGLAGRARDMIAWINAHSDEIRKARDHYEGEHGELDW